MFSMNMLPIAKRVQMVSALTEGCSMRSVSRMVGCSINTVAKFVVDMGDVCEDFHDRTVRGLKTERLQADEIWAFCRMKRKNVPEHLKDSSEVGDVWTWTVLDADSKLMVSWAVGDRSGAFARDVFADAAGRIVSDRVQITSDGYKFYKQAVREMFGESADYAELQKIYGAADGTANARYSPAVCIGCIRKHMIGNPDPAHINTSYVERQNLGMRMGMRRFTRLTNGFSKKLANHRASIALHFVHHNFCRKPKGLGGNTPAMMAGIADHAWTLEELVQLLEVHELANVGTEENKRGPYKPRKSPHA